VTPARKNLYLVVHRPRLNKGTFTQITEGVERIAPHIRARVIRNTHYLIRKWGRVSVPSLTVSFARLNRYCPPRGAVCAGKKLDKIEEMTLLAQPGIPVPRWELLEPGVDLDLSDWGPYVVEKPVKGLKGAGVRIRRRGRVRYKPVEDRLGARIAQEFIYTGRWPVSYRVSLLFGRVLFCVRCESSRETRPLEGADRFADHGGVNIVSTRKGCTYLPVADEEVMELARRAATAFPEIPLLGVDVVREQETGRTFVLEVNPGGWTWLFSSEAGRGIQRDCGFQIDDQFGGLAIASRVLAEETEARAR